MIDTISDELIVQWERQEERDRERIEEEASDKWVHDIEPDARERFIEGALNAWDAEADDRRDDYIARAMIDVRVVPEYDANHYPVTFDDAGTPMLQWHESWAGYRNVWVCFTEEDSDYYVIGGDERDVEYALTRARTWLRMKAQESA